MNRRPDPPNRQPQVIARHFEPHPWALALCRAWEILCAGLLTISVLLQVRRFIFSTSPANASEVVGWLCFDALFLLGGYAGYQLLCNANCQKR